MLFGSGASRQMLAVIQAGPTAYDKATDSVNKMGTAHNAAAKQAETLHGEEKTLEAEASDLAGKFGSVLLPVVTAVTGAFIKATTFVLSHKAAMIALAATVTGILGPAIAVFSINKMASLIGSFQQASQNMAKFAGSVESAVSRVVSAFGKQSSAAGKAASDIGTATSSMSGDVETSAASIEGDNGTAAGSFESVGGGAGTMATEVGAAETTTVGEVTAADSTIESENAAAAASFAGVASGAGAGLAAGAAGGALGGIALGGVVTAQSIHNNPVGSAMGDAPGSYEPPGGGLKSVSKTPLGWVLSHLPHFGAGGIVTEPTLAMVGESGTELIIPEDTINQLAPKGNKGAGLSARMAGGGDPEVTQWSHDAQIASQMTGVPVSILLADIQQESGGHPGEVSPTGALGLTQFEPGTAAEFGMSPAVAGGTTPADELKQIESQAEYLKKLGVLSNPTSALEGYYTGTPGSPAGAGYAASVLGMTGEYAGYNLKPGQTVGGGATAASASVLTLSQQRALLTQTIKQEDAGVKKDIASIEDTIKSRKETTLSATGKFGTKTVRATPEERTTAAGQIAAVKAGLEVEITQQKQALGEQTSQSKSELSKQTNDLKTGTTEFTKLVTAVHSGSLSELKTALIGAHGAKLADIEKDLDHDHSSALASLSKQLEAIHKEAMAEFVKDSKAATSTTAAGTTATTAAATTGPDAATQAADQTIADQAKQASDAITDATKVTLDQQAEAGQTGAALTAAQEQTALDQITQANDAAIDAATVAVDRAVGGSQAQQNAAASQLAEANATAAVQEAQANATLSTAQAAAQAATAVSTSTTTNAPVMNFTIYGNMPAGSLFTEAAWALRTGALPVAPAVTPGVPVA
jgi:hypothetical protein